MTEEDCISRQAVLDTLDKMDKALDDDRTVENYKELLSECYKDLSSITPKEKWIPVSERLPEEETDVLVYCETGAITVCCGSYSTEVSDTFIWYTGGWRYGKVVAWMPLPEPYRAESEVEFVRVEEPEQKTGEWEVYTSEEGKSRTCTCKLCGYKTGPYTWENPKYCAGCGARMINSPQNTIEDEEVKIEPEGKTWTNEEIEKGLKDPFGY